jgi:predicted lipid-binding transport protein (Tim44 family)
VIAASIANRATPSINSGPPVTAETITVDSLEIARTGVVRHDMHRRKSRVGWGTPIGGLAGGLGIGMAGAAMCSDPFWGCNPAAGFAGGFVVERSPGPASAR